MMWKEMRKFFIPQYVLIWLVVFFCLKVISTYFFSDADEVENREIYYSYLDEFGGKLDAQKEEALLARYDEFNQSSAKLNELEQQYDEGEITQEDYLQQLSEVAKIKQEGEVVKLFHSKYEYAAENPKTHYIMDENGWTQLLTEEHLDYLLVLLLFLISVPMFCSEYETEMNVLQLCSKNGRERLTLLKILLLGLVAMAVAFLFSLVDFCFYQQKYGLAFGDAPIQSLQFFEESIHHFTLMQLWWMVTFTRMVGALFLSMMILAVSVVVKKSLLSIVVNALLVSLPIVFSNSARLKYMLPLPTGLLYGTGYYFSDIYEYSYDAGEMEKNVSFQSFTQRQLGLIAGMTAVVLIGLIFVVVWKYLDLHIHRKKSSFVTTVLLVSLLTLGLSGCSREKEEFYENMSVQNLVSMTDQYQFTLDFLNRIICSDLETGESFSVLRNVFEQDSNDASFSVTFFATNQYLYYAKDYQETERNYDEHFEFQIYRVDLSDFLEECVYSKTYSHEDLTSFGLYFVSENYFYVHMNEDNTEKYYTINRRTGEWEWIPYAQGILYLGEYGNKVYYQNYENHIAVYDLRTKDTLVYEEVNLRSDSSIKNSAQYCICGKYCYYTNILNNDYIYRYDFETGENKRMVSETITQFGILANEQYLYYNSKGHTLYRMDVNTFVKEKLMENVNGRISLSVDGSALYVQSSEETEVWEKIN